MSKKERKKGRKRSAIVGMSTHTILKILLPERKKEQKNNVEDYEMNKRKSIENYSFYEYC